MQTSTKYMVDAAAIPVPWISRGLGGDAPKTVLSIVLLYYTIILPDKIYSIQHRDAKYRGATDHASHKQINGSMVCADSCCVTDVHRTTVLPLSVLNIARSAEA